MIGKEKGMEDWIQVKGNTMTIRMPEELDHCLAEQIRRDSDRILEQKNIREIIFDFRQTTFMDSSGIGLLMGRYRQIYRLGGSVKVIHAGERVRKILKMSGVCRVIRLEEEKGWK